MYQSFSIKSTNVSHFFMRTIIASNITPNIIYNYIFEYLYISRCKKDFP